jgi:protein involved in polysaccharide export with SLBB domain
MVVGAVVNSGSVPIERDMSVLEAIGAAGGFNSWANKSDVRVIRRKGEERVSYRFDYRAYLEGAPDSDILLKPGDVVVVTE